MADRFGGTVDGAIRQLGYEQPTPRELRRVTLACGEIASAESILAEVERAMEAQKPPDLTPDQAAFFKDLQRLAFSCEGCDGLPGEEHAPGCPYDSDQAE